jgi:competence protein ComEA
MTGFSVYEKTVLGMTAGFLLFVGAWFCVWLHSPAAYLVKTAAAPETQTLAQQTETDGADAWPDSLLAGEIIDLNYADFYDLQRLPNIGEKLAQAIVEERETNGSYTSVWDLTRVRGIGEKIAAALEEYAVAEEG